MRAALVALTITLVGGTLARPEWAGRFTHLLVAAVILAVLVDALVARIVDCDVSPARPFVPPDPPAPPSIETPDVAELVRLTERGRGPIPEPIVRKLRTACRGRLADHHRLFPDRVEDAPAIDALVGAHVRRLLAGTGDETDLPLRALPRLLDEMEDL